MKKRIRSFFHKYKHLWPLLYFFIYMPWFIILENNVTDNYHIMHCFMDDIIPFNELFIIPYLLWFLYLPAIFVFLFYHSTNEFYRLCAYEFTGMTICLLIYTIFPNGHDLRIDPGIRDNIFVNLVNFIYNNDTIDELLFKRHLGQKIRRSGGRTKGPRKRDRSLDELFRQKLIELIET